MKILVLMYSWEGARKTIDDHLYSFQRYVEGAEFFYLDLAFTIPFFLKWIKWDGIILHYTFTALRFHEAFWAEFSKKLVFLGELDGFKVAIPQDEYAKVIELQWLLKVSGVDSVFTCLFPIDYDKIYPLAATGVKHRFTTFTGFVDEASWDTVNRLSNELHDRKIDIGYRARNVPFWLGRHGRIKKEISDKVLETPNEFQLKLDVSTEHKDVFLGDDWLKFLMRCRCVLGCLGGASLLDPDGSIRKQIDAYVIKNPNATFDEVEKQFFPGKDYSLSLLALSPRHFECAMTKTCQILVEGDYQGVLIPERHYIEVKKDYSNLEEVFQKVADKGYCEQIAENAYREVALSDRYTYRAFANQIIDHIKEFSPKRKNNPMIVFLCRKLLKIHNNLTPRRKRFHRIIPRAWGHFKHLTLRYFNLGKCKHLIKSFWGRCKHLIKNFIFFVTGPFLPNEK